MNEDFKQYNRYATSSAYNAILNLTWKLGESKLNPCWLIVLTNSPDTAYVVNWHEYFDQYRAHLRYHPHDIKPYQSHSASIIWLSYHVNKDDGNRQTGRRTDAGDDNHFSAEEDGG